VTDSGILAELLELGAKGGASTMPKRSAASAPPDEPAASVKRRFIELTREYVAKDPLACVAIPGAPEFLRRLRELPGAVVAIATGGWRETAELKLETAGIDYQGLAMATSSDCEARVDIMRLAEAGAAAEGPFAARWYFGDAPWDQRASRELGYRFVAIGGRVEHSTCFDDFLDAAAVLEVLDLQGVCDQSIHVS
jgi:beta-phosphoglucomutase-like phosphatase (HAD superfamily)